jgi:predicted DCC family thiol-disulfide oxidoreductase YuxK
MIEPGRQYLLFDGDCGICTWSSDVIKEMDREKRFTVLPYQMFSESDLAVNYFLWRKFPWTLLVALIYAVPVLFLLELIVYRLIANNRARISAWLGMEACLLKR